MPFEIELSLPSSIMSSFAANMPSDPEATCIASRDTGKQLYVLGKDEKTFDSALSGERKITGKVREVIVQVLRSQSPTAALGAFVRDNPRAKI